jgi:hypothetical protein
VETAEFGNVVQFVSVVTDYGNSHTTPFAEHAVRSVVHVLRVGAECAMALIRDVVGVHEHVANFRNKN